MYVYFDARNSISTAMVRAAVASQLNIAQDSVNATVSTDGEGLVISVPSSVHKDVSARDLAIQLGASRADVSGTSDMVEKTPAGTAWVALASIGCSVTSTVVLTFFATYK